MTMLLTVRALKKDFGDKEILKHINMDIKIGERLGLVGDNGAGKTTLIRLLSASLNPEGGSLKPDGGSISWHVPGIGIGLLAQDCPLEEETAGQGSTLSGGERMKLALRTLWAKNPGFIILDEPTNHLDHQGITWLIRELERYQGTVLMISHDRYFLDQTVHRILEIEKGQLSSYNGNYSAYQRLKNQRRTDQIKAYQLQEEERQRIESQVAQLRVWSAKAYQKCRFKALKMDGQVQSRIKRLDKMNKEGLAKPEGLRRVSYRMEASEQKGRKVLEASQLTMGFGSKRVIEPSDFYVMRQEKVGLYGPNGCGKTTLLKLILGELSPKSGQMSVGQGLKIGYLSQLEMAPEGATTVSDCFEWLESHQRTHLQTLLVSLGLPKGLLPRKLDELSMGQLTQLKMAKLLIEPLDLLVLDEPLNHLDLQSREKLESVLSAYTGTLLLVSHDRYMMERLCDKLLVFEKGKIRRWESGLADYLAEASKSRESQKDKGRLKEELLKLDFQLAQIDGALSRLSRTSPDYEGLEKQYFELAKSRTVLKNTYKGL